jgi:threonine/homoserine/homoserine lactone efflux protein
MTGLGFVLLVLVWWLYFLPTMIALGRGHPQWGVIAVLNLLLGWTIVGWVGTLVWARRATQKRVALFLRPR